MPARTPGRVAQLVAFANQLRANPGEWKPYPLTLGPDPAKWKSQSLSATSLRSTASRIRNGQVAAFGPGFEATITGTHLSVRYAAEEARA